MTQYYCFKPQLRGAEEGGGGGVQHAPSGLCVAHTGDPCAMCALHWRACQSGADATTLIFELYKVDGFVGFGFIGLRLFPSRGTLYRGLLMNEKYCFDNYTLL